MIPSPNPAVPPKPPITLTIPHLPGAQMNQWHDGSVKITFPAEQFDDVINHFEQNLAAIKLAADLVKNPPKKCPSCRGQGQVIVKSGTERLTQVCPGCNGSGSKIHRPTDPAKLMTRNVGHVPPANAPVLPHETYVPEQIRNEPKKRVDPTPMPGLREVTKEELSQENAETEMDQS